MKTKSVFLMGLVALFIVVLIGGCGSGSGIQASWTKTSKDGTTTTQKVAIGSEEKSAEDTKKADADKTVKTVRELLGADGPWVELDKSGDLKLSPQGKQLLEGEQPEAKTETRLETKTEPEPTKKKEEKAASSKI